MQSQAIQGNLKPDGSLELSEKPRLPAGPVEITIRAMPEERLDAMYEEMERQRRSELQDSRCHSSRCSDGSGMW